MKVAIIGGGFLGLILAQKLSRKGYRATVLESDSQIGGLSTWHDYGRFVWDKYYHVILPSDRHLLGLIGELGLTPEMRWYRTRTGFLWQNRLVSMSDTREFLRFPALKWHEKIRLGLGILRCVHADRLEDLHDQTAHSWLKSQFGTRVYATIWAPLLLSKFGPLAQQVPASFIQATIARYYSARSRRGGHEAMGYLSGGYRPLLEALQREIEGCGGIVELKCAVSMLRDLGDEGIAVTTSTGERIFDRVVSTLPTPDFRRISGSPPVAESGSAKPPAYLGIVCGVLQLKRSLSGYYVTNLIQRGLPFTGIVELTQLVRLKETGGVHVVYLPRYDLPDSPWFEMTDSMILTRFFEGLGGIWPEIEKDILDVHIHRQKRVQPIFLPGTRVRRESLANARGTLVSVNSELIGTDTLNNNAIVRLANRFLEERFGESGRAR